ncbi:hypothetical protein BDB00DRAFT_463851 [Zychaea mexicana]|uniref:uncharacterized protein n=1 Tax=Zychaea mexicana TaxID=64656 RepID=UPI0022FE2E6F|nr:uncharacterized protein BDB00DRAFT_463851 [Zychaea mexicana]KAI9491961.1 hypothetical protein BDB00DRAFT_463851 [Zychaea mexicana]
MVDSCCLHNQSVAHLPTTGSTGVVPMCPLQPLHPRWLQPVSAPMPTPTAFTSRNHPLRCLGRTPSPDEGGDRQTHQSTVAETTTKAENQTYALLDMKFNHEHFIQTRKLPQIHDTLPSPRALGRAQNDRHTQRNDRPTTMSPNPPGRKRNDDRTRSLRSTKQNSKRRHGRTEGIDGIDGIDGHRRHRRA